MLWCRRPPREFPSCCKTNFHFFNRPHAAFPFSCMQRKGTPYSGPQKWMTARGVWPWGIQIGPFAVYETYFCKMNFHFIHKSHAAFPFSCMQRKGQPTVDLKSDWHQGVFDPGAFELDHLQSTKPIFAIWISTFLTSHMQHFPFLACREKGIPQWTPKVTDTKRCMTLGHSNWTSSSLRNPFFKCKFPLY